MINQVLSQDSFWIVNKKLSKEIGMAETLLFSELLFARKKFGFEFYITVEDLEIELGMSRAVRRGAMQKLQTLGILTVEKKGIPCRNHYTIHDEIVAEILSRGKNDPTGGGETHPTINKKEIKKIPSEKEIPNLKAKETENQARIDFKDIERTEIGKDMGSSVEGARIRSVSVVEWDEDDDEIKKTSSERKGEFDALNWFDSLSRENPGMDTSKLTEGEKVVKSFGSFPTDWNWSRERKKEKQLYKTYGADGVYKLLWGLNQLIQTQDWWRDRFDLRFTNLSSRVIELIGERNGFTGNGTTNEKEKQVDRGNRKRENGTLQNRTEVNGFGDTRRPDDIKLDRTGT